MKFLFLIVAGIISSATLSQDNYQDDHVLVKLNWRYLDLKVVDDDRMESLPLGKLLNQEGLEIIHKSGGDFLLDNDCRKVFPSLKTTDTISIGRLGNKVKIPTFWAWFNITLDKELSIEEFCARKKLFRPLFLEAHPNWIGDFFSIPNDSLFSEQNSLASTEFPNGHIDLDSVWNLTTGKPWVKVGVYDTGIDTSHADLKILGGKGFFEDATAGEIPWFSEPVSSHGTRVAGIIGARRNNTIGVAGIAGGDGTDSTGTSIIDFTILPETGFDVPDIEQTCQAIVDGARFVGTYYDWEPLIGYDYANDAQGWGIWLANHSYGFIIEQFKIEFDDTTIVDDPEPPYSTCTLCIEAYLFSNENNVTNIAARGNIKNPATLDDEYGSNDLWPQDYPDHMIISVGGSGWDGNRWGNDNTTLIETGFKSQLGRNIDIIAPATDTLIRTTQISYLEGFAIDPDTTITDYSTFAGTSSAAPHVTGTLALLLSYYNKPCYSNYNLANEDMEKMLEKSAIDVEAVGYDDSSGHGRLNAFNLFDSLYRPYYQIVHPNSDTPIDVNVSFLDSVTFHGKSFFQYGPYEDEELSEPTILSGSDYKTVLYKVEATYDFSSYLTSPTTEFLDSWMRVNTSTFATPQEDSIYVGSFPSGDSIKQFNLERYGTKISGTGSTVTLEGYLYHFVKEIDGPDLDIWYPADTNDFHFDYSVYLRDTVAGLNFDFPCEHEIVLIDTVASIHESIKPTVYTYPNPFNEEINVTYDYNNQRIESITVLTITGREIFVENDLFERKASIATAGLSSGVYLLKIKDEEGNIVVQKIVKE